MAWMREMWGGIRDTSLVAAQVVTLGVLAMVLGMLALNAVVHRTPSSTPTQVGPPHPLVLAPPTIVPNTPTAMPATATLVPLSSTAVPSQTPMADLASLTTPNSVATSTQLSVSRPPATAVPANSTVMATAIAAPPTPVAPPNSTETAVAVSGQMMKILPSTDGLPARVRAEPNTKSPILMRVPLGAQVEVLGATTGDEIQPGNTRWLRIRWKQVTGYVYSTLVGG